MKTQQNNFKKLQLLLLFFIVIASCKKPETGNTVSCTNAVSPIHIKGAQYQALIDSYVNKGLPGMSLLVGDSSGVWYGASGKADLQNDINYMPCTNQKLGSITKMMFAAMTMKLVEEGTVNLDDMVSKWLDAATIKNVENADKVTLRNCLQHTTGIYDIISNSDFYLAALHNPNKHWTGEELLAYIKKQPAIFEANTSAKYSNSNFLILALCIEKITGKSNSVLLHDKVLTPLGMTETYYSTHDALPENTAQGYFDLYNNKTITNVSNIGTGNGFGYTGVYSNVFDLQKFVKGVFIDKTLLKQSSLNTMMQWVKDAGGDNTDFGLGLFKRDTDLGVDYRVGHTGGDLGYASEVYYFPKSNRYYILNLNYGTNGDSFLKPAYLELVRALADLVKK